jgi:hypothetical protein
MRRLKRLLLVLYLLHPGQSFVSSVANNFLPDLDNTFTVSVRGNECELNGIRPRTTLFQILN